MTKRKRYDGELQHLRNLEDKIDNSGVGREIKAILEALNTPLEERYKEKITALEGLGTWWSVQLGEARKEIKGLKADNQAELEVSEALRGKLKKARDEVGSLQDEREELQCTLATHKKAVEAQKGRIKELVIRAQKAERGLEGEETPDFPPIPMESAEDAETRRMNEELKMAEDRDCPPGGYEQGPDELRD